MCASDVLSDHSTVRGSGLRFVDLGKIGDPETTMFVALLVFHLTSFLAIALCWKENVG
jgi:hypothetical protein